VSGWAFDSDKNELTPAQRAKVRQEILAMLAQCQTWEQATIRRVADKVGRR
jgi:hypothetical protein